MDTLGAALAEAGRFDEAVERTRQALAAAAGNEKPHLQKRLELYQSRKPFRLTTDQ